MNSAGQGPASAGNEAATHDETARRRFDGTGMRMWAWCMEHRVAHGDALSITNPHNPARGGVFLSTKAAAEPGRAAERDLRVAASGFQGAQPVQGGAHLGEAAL